MEQYTQISPQQSCANLLFLRYLQPQPVHICMHGHSIPFPCSALWTEPGFCVSRGGRGEMTLALTGSAETEASANDHRAGHQKCGRIRWQSWSDAKCRIREHNVPNVFGSEYLDSSDVLIKQLRGLPTNYHFVPLTGELARKGGVTRARGQSRSSIGFNGKSF